MTRMVSLILCLVLVNALLIGGIMMTLAQDTSTGKTPTPDWDTIKKQAEAEKAAAEARKAQAEASLAAFKAKIGEVPSPPYGGAVELKEKAGITEAALLAAKAVNIAAQKIRDSLLKETEGKTVLLYAAGEFPNFQALIMFHSQIDLLDKAFSYAKDTSDKADAEAPPPVKKEEVPPPVKKEKAVPPAAAAGVILAAMDNLLGFFRTDYTVGGIEIKLEDSLLIHALSGAISGSNKNVKVQLPAIYGPGALSDARSEILKKFSNLSQRRLDAQAYANRQDKLATLFKEDADKETDPAKKATLLNKAKIHAAAVDVWKASVSLYDTFFSKLTTVDDKGATLLTNVIRESIVADALEKGDFLLLVKLQQSGGAFYTKKNMWTLFGTMPFYHMGGVVASFVLLDGKTGAVLKSGVVPVHGGFVKANDLPQEIE
jgi:hypothetical protein